MATGQLSTVLGHLRRLAGGTDGGDLTDAQLLERFATGNQEAAFAALVQRYGPMVLGVCRRILHNPDDAEDAFQATFLILVRKAGAIRNRAALGCWLHQVARRVALRARADQVSRRRHEGRVAPGQAPDFIAAVVWRDLQPVLDEEVGRLPDRYRVPFVLCYLEGKTYAKVARQLRCLPGTVSHRLARAREMLRLRLVRRGLALPAGILAAALSAHAACAALPATLAAATVRAAFDGGAARVAALADEGIKAMNPSTGKFTLALVLAVGLIGATLSLLAARAPAGPGAGKPGPQKKAAPARTSAPRAALENAGKAAPGKTITVTGRVLDAAGKPVANAVVVVLAYPRTNPRIIRNRWWSGDFYRPQIVARGRSDAQGKFRLTGPRTSKKSHQSVLLLAGAEGCALAQADIKPDAPRPDIQVRLARERVFHGRLVDLQGKPAANVKVFLTHVLGSDAAKHLFQVTFQEPPEKLPPWPAPAVTDARGRFSFRGLGPDWHLSFHVRDGRFARHDFEVKPAELNKKEITRSLPPARVLEGTVTYGDTRKPVPGARLVVVSQAGQFRFGRVHEMKTRADAKGHFRITPYAGGHFTLIAYPPEGTPYLLLSKQITWRQADLVKRAVPMALVRGVLVTGKVTEKVSGKPVAGASLTFEPNRDNNPFFREDVRPFWGGREQIALSGKDGTFRLPVLPGPGHLLVNGPTPDYLKTEIGTKQLSGRQVNPDWRNYFDACVPLNLKPQRGPHKLAVTLRRGVILAGKVVGPDGKPVARAVLMCRSYIPAGSTLNPVPTKEVQDGQFELPGCDPNKPTEVFFLDVKNHLGTVVKLSPKELGGKALTVKLRRCGKATVRLVDAKGKPVAGAEVFVEVVITPGVPFAESLRKPGRVADAAYLSSLDPEGHNRLLRTDAKGRITFPNLIPGATHWLIGNYLGRGFVDLDKEFKVEPGKTRDLGDVTVKVHN
jgi:RNA polymerase sigma factor (sigma-70 family)